MLCSSAIEIKVLILVCMSGAPADSFSIICIQIQNKFLLVVQIKSSNVHSFGAKRTEPEELSWINSSSSRPWSYLDQRTWQLEPSVHQLSARTLP
jgi:hypothetical protein